MGVGSAAMLLPQWQGYAAGDGPARGAQAIAAALAETKRWAVPQAMAEAPDQRSKGSAESGGPQRTIVVPGWHPLTGERGDVLGLTEIVDQAAAALGWLDAAAPAHL